MKASIYYTLYSHGTEDQTAFKSNDHHRLCLLLEKLKGDGHDLTGVYITDRSSALNIPLKNLVRNDAKQGCFDILYLYVYNIPVSISAGNLLHILDLPVDGRRSIFD